MLPLSACFLMSEESQSQLTQASSLPLHPDIINTPTRLIIRLWALIVYRLGDSHCAISGVKLKSILCPEINPSFSSADEESASLKKAVHIHTVYRYACINRENHDGWRCMC